MKKPLLHEKVFVQDTLEILEKDLKNIEEMIPYFEQRAVNYKGDEEASKRSLKTFLQSLKDMKESLQAEISRRKIKKS